MWYVKDETGKCYLKSENLIKCSNYTRWYNENKKFCGQRLFKFNLYTFTTVSIFGSHEEIIDVNKHTLHWSFFTTPNNIYKHVYAVKDFDKKHKKYLEKKLKKIKSLCKKYHVWPYNKEGRKCDGFDF